MKQAEEWFDSIYTKYHDQMVKIAFGILDDRELAKDIAQNTFLTLLLKQEQLRDHCNIYGWLVKTVKNHIGNELQRACHSLEVPLLPKHESVAAETPVDFLSVLPTELSESEQHILYLFYEVGLSHEEIAVKLGCTPAACRMRLYRAKKHCQDCWGRDKIF